MISFLNNLNSINITNLSIRVKIFVLKNEQIKVKLKVY